MHFHWKKSEDIINRGGGNLIITVYQDDGEGGLSDQPVLVNSDGRSYYAPAGTGVLLRPGESITCGLISTTTSRWSREPATC